MSGGGSSGGTSPYFPPKNDDCASLVFKTHLASPSPDLVPSLKQGQTLEVGRDNSGSVIVFSTDGYIGTILTRELAQLANCLDQGSEFIATVISIADGMVEVKVAPL
jgi:hypothetical protein